MVDITAKSNTLRMARAQAVVKVSKAETIEAIKNRQVPKGDVLEIAKAAGLLGVKKTSNLIPDCHPLPIEYAAIKYEMKELEIVVEMEVKTIYKTGVEVEAMHGVSIVALTMYDMLKPIDKGVSIENIRLLEKKGGKTDYKGTSRELTAAVLIMSDTISAGKNEDKSGRLIKNRLEQLGLKINHFDIIPDDKSEIEKKVKTYVQEKIDLVVTTGGTGLSPRDVTPDVIQPLLDKEIPGIAEAARQYGQERTPFAMLSRNVAGLSGDTLIITLPGSAKAVQEGLDVLFPHVLHIFDMMEAKGH